MHGLEIQYIAKLTVLRLANGLVADPTQGNVIYSIKLFESEILQP